jgi:hypothetical protein
MCDRWQPSLPEFWYELVHLRALKCWRSGDACCVQFERGWSLSIRSPHVLSRDGVRTENADVLVGARLLRFLGRVAVDRLVFDNGCEVALLLDDGVTEDIVVHGPNDRAIVWN